MRVPATDEIRATQQKEKEKTADKRYAQRAMPATNSWRLAAQNAMANVWHEYICFIR
jgi:hypothetical protein